MFALIVYSVLLALTTGKGNLNADPLLCAGRDAISKPVIEYCAAQNGSLRFRCCLLSDPTTIIAVDLVNLNLATVPDFTRYSNLKISVVDLRLNPQLEPSRKNDFLAMQSLDDLLLPEHFDCPGGQRVWQIVDKITDPVGNRCLHQQDFCVNSTGTCSERTSYCSTNGPDHFLCLCKSNLSGYKCLRRGSFPIGVFLGSSAAVTVVASTLLFWTQRRHVMK
jgi:hypothetical protein